MPDYPSGLALGLRIQGYRVRFPARAGHFWVTFWSCRGNFFMDFGRCWEVFGSTLGLFSDGLGRFPRKSSEVVENVDSQKCLGAFFPDRGALD